MPALQRARPLPAPKDGPVFSRVALPAQRRQTRLVKDTPIDAIAREIVEWIRG
jgi:electron transfer flavoprotein beta subunit